jgi:hypothetical protein
MLLGIWIYFIGLFHDGGSDGEAIFFYAVTFWTVPVIGLYYSLRCRSFIGAFLATIAAALIAPVVLPGAIRFMNLYGAWPWRVGPSIFGSLVQGVTAIVCWVGLQERLRRRAFPLERGEA